MQSYGGLLQWQTSALCLTGGDSAAGAPFGGAVPYAQSPPASHVSCVLGAVSPDGVAHPGYLDRTLNPPRGLYVVTCDASARIDFSRTPLAWGVFWSPVIHAHAEALPPPFRQ